MSTNEQPSNLEIDRQESKSEVIERHQEGRRNLFKEIVTRISSNTETNRAISAAINATFGASIKLSFEAIKGKTVEGQKLTPLGRLMDALIVGTDVGGKVIGVIEIIKSGDATNLLERIMHAKTGAETYGISWVLWGAMYGPDILTPVFDQAARSLEDKHQTSARLMRVCANAASTVKSSFFEKGRI